MKRSLAGVEDDLKEVKGNLEGAGGDLDGVTDVLAEVRGEKKTLAKRVSHMKVHWRSMGAVCITFFFRTEIVQ